LKGNGEELIIYDAIVSCEEAHQEDEVADLTKGIEGTSLQLVTDKAKNDANQEQQGAVADISEHDAKQEGEGYDREDSRVSFLEHRNTICVNNFLKGVSKLVSLNVSRLCDSMILKSSDLGCTKIS
jgi:hypothetical protein